MHSAKPGAATCGLLLVVVAFVWALLSADGAYASSGSTERVSVGTAGIEGDNDSYEPAVSADGRYVAFQSYASNLVDGDTSGYRDVFVHDRQTGATERVSVSTGGAQADGDSRLDAMSADGRFVAFSSYATNLVDGDTNSMRDTFVHDRQTGTTERVSVGTASNEGNGESRGSAISADGRFVAFHSFASNLVDGDTNGLVDVFVRDRQAGTTERVSGDASGNEGNGDSWWPAMSADGRYVAFESVASNLVAGDTNSKSDIFVHDRQTGTTERVSVDTSGSQGNGDSLDPAISADGRYVAFYSCASDLVPGDTNSSSDIFVHDRQTGTTERVSVGTSGNQGNGDSHKPVLSADGRYAAFQTLASNLVPGDTNSTYDVFVHDRQTGATERVSVDLTGGNGDGISQWPAMSLDGRYVAFQSVASNLVAGDTNNEFDIFVRAREVPEAGQEAPEINQEASGAGQEAPVISQETSGTGQEAPVVSQEAPVTTEDIYTTSGTPRLDLDTLGGIGLGLVPVALVMLVVGFLMTFGRGARVP
jgi:Tol biopolymer transport system component